MTKRAVNRIEAWSVSRISTTTVKLLPDTDRSDRGLGFDIAQTFRCDPVAVVCTVDEVGEELSYPLVMEFVLQTKISQPPLVNAILRLNSAVIRGTGKVARRFPGKRSLVSLG